MRVPLYPNNQLVNMKFLEEWAKKLKLLSNPGMLTPFVIINLDDSF